MSRRSLECPFPGRLTFPRETWYNDLPTGASCSGKVSSIKKDAVPMFFVYYALTAAGVVVLDQIVKYLVAVNIPLQATVPFLPGVLQLTCVHNTGAAFSSFQGQQWLFALIFAAFTVALLWEYFRKPMAFTRLERFCVAAIYGGGLGNMVDRVRQGYVVDMFETTFMRFPVFNVADIFITCGCVLLMVHLALFNQGFWKDAEA